MNVGSDFTCAHPVSWEFQRSTLSSWLDSMSSLFKLHSWFVPGFSLELTLSKHCSNSRCTFSSVRFLQHGVFFGLCLQSKVWNFEREESCGAQPVDVFFPGGFDCECVTLQLHFVMQHSVSLFTAMRSSLPVAQFRTLDVSKEPLLRQAPWNQCMHTPYLIISPVSFWSSLPPCLHRIVRERASGLHIACAVCFCPFDACFILVDVDFSLQRESTQSLLIAVWTWTCTCTHMHSYPLASLKNGPGAFLEWCERDVQSSFWARLLPYRLATSPVIVWLLSCLPTDTSSCSSMTNNNVMLDVWDTMAVGSSVCSIRELGFLRHGLWKVRLLVNDKTAC